MQTQQIPEKLQQLKTKLRYVTNIQASVAVLGWDQQVNMPAGGTETRAEQLSTLEKMAHEAFITDEIGLLLEELADADFAYDSDEASLVRVTQRDYQQARKLSSELVEEMSRTFSIGQQVWTQARANKNFAEFQETLTKIVDLNIQVAETFGYQDTIYDALLDQFEPGMKTADVQRVFDQLRDRLIPLVKAISAKLDAVDDSMLKQRFPKKGQWDFGMDALKAVGFDLQRGRQDESVHPFTSSFSMNDVRLTTRLDETMFPSSLFGTLHEAGHGLYEQNVAQNLAYTPLVGGTSLGVHESQSRLWENILGRSEPFWQFHYPKLQSVFPDQLANVSRTAFYRAVNKVEPSFIRVEADEVTYNLHIFIRFELEQALLNQKLSVADLPDAWNTKMESYLGITPPNDSLGVLQDIHWSGGIMGYFPTYTLGNILSMQFYTQTLKEIPDLPMRFAHGQFMPLLDWFRENIHQHGRKFTANELIKRITGADQIEAGPYLDYITQKFSQIYAL